VPRALKRTTSQVIVFCWMPAPVSGTGMCPWATRDRWERPDLPDRTVRSYPSNPIQSRVTCYRRIYRSPGALCLCGPVAVEGSSGFAEGETANYCVINCKRTFVTSLSATTTFIAVEATLEALHPLQVRSTIA